MRQSQDAKPGPPAPRRRRDREVRPPIGLEETRNISEDYPVALPPPRRHRWPWLLFALRLAAAVLSAAAMTAALNVVAPLLRVILRALLLWIPEHVTSVRLSEGWLVPEPILQQDPRSSTAALAAYSDGPSEGSATPMSSLREGSREQRSGRGDGRSCSCCCCCCWCGCRARSCCYRRGSGGVAKLLELVLAPWFVEQMSPAWLSHLLQRAGYTGADVAAVDLQPIGDSMGYSSTTTRVAVRHFGGGGQAPAVTVGRSAPSALVVKRSRPNFAGRVTAALGMLTDEGKFYADGVAAEVCRRSGVRVPRAVLARSMAGSDLLLVMEAVEGHCPDPTEWTSSEDVPVGVPDMCVVQLARLHASFSGAPAARMARRHRFLDARSEKNALLPAFFQRVAPRYLSQWAHTFPAPWTSSPQRASEELKHAAAVLHDAMAWLDGDTSVISDGEGAQACTTPATLLHGDYRATNMVWPTYPSGETARTRATDLSPPCVLDWQLCQVGNPMVDLAHQFCVDLPVEYRREHERRLFALYVETFEATLNEFGGGGGDVPVRVDADMLWTQYQVALLTQPFALTVVSTAMLSVETEKNRAQFSAWLTRMAAAVSDHSSAAVACRVLGR